MNYRHVKHIILVLALTVVPQLGQKGFCQGRFFTGLDDGYSFSVIPVVLPIELGHFRVNANDKKVYINWSTLTETNNSHFIIEKSFNGLSWELVDKINGAGNSFQELKYSLIDTSPYMGLSYYRIVQVDFDSTSVVSARASVFVKSDLLFSIYPNPVREKLVIEFLTEQEEVFNFTISDIRGEIFYHQKKIATINSQKWIVDIDNLKRGTYQLHAESSSGQIFIHRLIKL